MPPVTVPVYVVHWNAPEWCAEAVNHLRGSDIPVDVVVIDNSNNFVSSIVPVRRPAGNLGYAGAANLGLQEWLLRSESEWCAVASHDVVVAPGSLRRMIDEGQRRRDVGIVGLDAGGDGTWVSGTLMVLRRRCIEQIGGFYDAFGSYMEDRELCLRAGDHGWAVVPVTGVASGQGHQLDRSERVRAVVPNELLMWWRRREHLRLAKAILRFVAKAVRHAAIAVARCDRTHLRVSGAYLTGLGGGAVKIRRHRRPTVPPSPIRLSRP